MQPQPLPLNIFQFLSPNLCLETVFPALILSQNCYVAYIIIQIFSFLKTGTLIKNWFSISSATYHTTLKAFPHRLRKQEDKGISKIQIFKIFSELEKNW